MVLDCSYQCAVCANSCTCVYPLLRTQQVSVEKLYNALKIKTSPNGYPKYACERCVTKIEIFEDLIGALLHGQRYFHDVYEKMHDNLTDPSKNKDSSEPHIYNCQCPECQGKFGSLPLLVQVIEEESQKSTAQDEPFDQARDLSMPSTSQEQQTPAKRLQCGHCGKQFSHRGDLNKHIRKHTGEQPYTCEICGRKFTHTSNLQRHLKVHSGHKPFACDVCGKKFGRKDKLDNHRKTKLCKKNSARLLGSSDS